MSNRRKSDLPDPWERQVGESAKAFEAFTKYRDMTPGERSIRKVAQNLSKSATLIKNWSARYGWVERATAWDDEEDRKTRVEQDEARRKMNKTHADLGTALLVKAAKGLKAIPDEELTAADVARLVEVGSKLERQARGMKENAVLEITGEDGGPIETNSKVTIYLPSNGREDKSGGEA